MNSMTWVAGIVGGVLGGLISLAAIFITNRSNDRRSEKQLAHDTLQRREDRAATWRRPVYLSAMTKLDEMKALLGEIAAIDPADVNRKTAQAIEFFKAVSPVLLVSRESTLKRVMELRSVYGRLFMELLADAAPAHKLKIDININRRRCENLETERTRVISDMRQAIQSSDQIHDRAYWSDLFDNNARQMAGVTQEYTNLTDKYSRALSDYAVSTMAKLARHGNLEAEVLVSLRGELDLDTDIERMKSAVKEQNNEAIRELERCSDMYKQVWSNGSAQRD